MCAACEYEPHNLSKQREPHDPQQTSTYQGSRYKTFYNLDHGHVVCAVADRERDHPVQVAIHTKLDRNLQCCGTNL